MARTNFKSLRVRVLLVALAGTLVFSVAVTVIFATIFVDQLRDGLAAKAESIAGLLARNLTSALDFDDDTAAAEILAGVRTDQDFIYAQVGKSDGSVFATTGQLEGRKFEVRMVSSTEIRWEDDTLEVAAPIEIRGERAGTVQVFLSQKRISAAAGKVHLIGFLVCVILVVLVTVFFTQLMGRLVVRPLVSMTGMVTLLGDGDLRSRGETPDNASSEIGQMYAALERATGAFRDNVEALAATSLELSMMADEILESTNDLSAAVGEQASAVSETSVTLEEVEKTGQMSATSASKIVDVARDSVKASRGGLEAVNTSLEEINGVKSRVDTIADSLSALNAQLGEVDLIIASVNDVTRQSHTLSINASIEAAKAGKAGAGFVIVANQMRALSHQSQEATEQVRVTLGKTRESISELNGIAEDGRVATVKGVESVERSGVVIKELTEIMNNAAQMARAIEVNVQQQVTGLQQTSLAMAEINYAAQSNLEGIQLVESRGASLRERAEVMQELVSRFKTE